MRNILTINDKIQTVNDEILIKITRIDCDDCVPYVSADLRNIPTGTTVWAMPGGASGLVGVSGCCSGSDNCISIGVIFDEVVKYFFIYEQTVPESTAEGLKIDCVAPVTDYIPVVGNKWYNLTICKPGTEKRAYSISTYDENSVPA